MHRTALRRTRGAPPINLCDPAKSAAVKRTAISLAEKVKVTIAKSEQLHPLQTFEVNVELTDPLFDVKYARVTIGLSDNAQFREIGDDFAIYNSSYVPSDSEILGTVQRATILFHSDDDVPSSIQEKRIAGLQTSRGKTKVRIAIQAWSNDPIQIMWVVSVDKVRAAKFGGSIVECTGVSEIQKQTIAVKPNPLDETLAKASCEVEKSVLQPIADHATITFLTEKTVIAVGEAIKVNWKLDSRFPTDRPVYLIVALPEHARFEGQGVIAVLPKAKAPNHTKYQAERLRAFAPLHMPGTQTESSFYIKPFRAGDFILNYAMVANTKCGEYVLRDGGTQQFAVAEGKPQVVIQDFFSTEKPQRIIGSNNGQYRLEIFANSFRVFDIRSETKILDEVGQNPNFSPTARFVAALDGPSDQDTGGKMKVFDLVAGQRIKADVEGPVLAWAAEDSVLIEGTYPRGELKIRQSLFDKKESNKDDTKANKDENQEDLGLVVPLTRALGRSTSAWEGLNFQLDLERGIVLLAKAEDEATTIWELATGFSTVFTSKQSNLVLHYYGIATYHAPKTWDPGEDLRLSHYSPIVDEMEKEVGSKRGFQKPHLYKHKDISSPKTETLLKAASLLPVSKDWRAKVVEVDGVIVRPRGSGFAEQLAPFGIELKRNTQPEALVTRTIWSKASAFAVVHTPIFKSPPGGKGIEQRLFKSIPIARKYLNTESKNSDGTLAEQPCTGPMDNGAYAWTLQERAHGMWEWADKENQYWLVQMLCYWKGASNSKTYLFAKHGQGRPVVVDLFDPLFRSATDVTNEQLTRIKPYLVEKNRLLIGLAGGAAAAIIDLDNLDSVSYLHGLRETSALQELFLSSDDRFVVQLNTDGRFYLYPRNSSTVWNAKLQKEQDNGPTQISDFPTVPLALGGRWIDDEILLYSEAGYYWGSYEAGQFVHLRFPGDPGIYPIAQFANQLNRPDIVRAVLNGDKAPDIPPLRIPPQISLQAGPIADGKLKIAIEAKGASSLRTAKIFIDGRLLTQIDLNGTVYRQQKEIKVSPPAQWLTAIAIDENGSISTPANLKLELKGPSTARLLGLLVGIDTYADPGLGLNFAKSDAVRVKQALDAVAHFQYAASDLPLLPDARAQQIEQKLESIVARTEVNDTLLFFFSGHGFRDANGHYYLATGEFSKANQSGTGLSWSRVSTILKRSKARIIVILDACHSGQSGSEEVAMNDQLVSGLQSIEVPMVILAASKGRQVAYEDSQNTNGKWKGGVFAYALSNLLGSGRQSADKNKNGTLEISEIYSALKSTIVTETSTGAKGVQTPWLERRNVVGDFPLF